MQFFKYLTFSVISVILFSSLIVVNMPQQALAASPTTITFDDGGTPGSGTITVTDLDGIKSITITSGKRGSSLGSSGFTFPGPTSAVIILTYSTSEGFIVTVVDCDTITTVSNIFGVVTKGGGSGDGNTHKVEVCHKDKTIEVSVSAEQVHIDHGDTTGPCP